MIIVSFHEYHCYLRFPSTWSLSIMRVLSHCSHVWLFATLWTIAHQAPLSMGFSRQEYWSGLSCSPPGDLPNPGIKPASLMSPALAGGFFTTSATWEAPAIYFFGVIVQNYCRCIIKHLGLHFLYQRIPDTCQQLLDSQTNQTYHPAASKTLL